MKITKRQLKRIIKEEKRRLLNEEGADCVKDYMAMGYSRSEAYKECEDYGEQGWRSSSRSRYRSSPRKTSYVGASANAERIAAIEAALENKPNNFLKSILDQLNQGRGLSQKQNAIVKKILLKHDTDAASLFEGTITRKRIKTAIAKILK